MVCIPDVQEVRIGDDIALHYLTGKWAADD